MYIFKISPHRWSSPTKGWAEPRYIREVKDVQGTSNTSRILKDIQEVFSDRIPKDGRSAYRHNVGGSTLRVPVEVLFQCLQSQRRRFYAPSLKCHIRRDFKNTGHIAPPSATPSSEPGRRPNISTTPRKDCELIPSCWEGLGCFKRPSMMPGVCYKRTFNCIC